MNQDNIMGIGSIKGLITALAMSAAGAEGEEFEQDFILAWASNEDLKPSQAKERFVATVFPYLKEHLANRLRAKDENKESRINRYRLHLNNDPLFTAMYAAGGDNFNRDVEKFCLEQDTTEAEGVALRMMTALYNASGLNKPDDEMELKREGAILLVCYSGHFMQVYSVSKRTGQRVKLSDLKEHPCIACQALVELLPAMAEDDLPKIAVEEAPPLSEPAASRPKGKTKGSLSEHDETHHAE
jgi:hypothetical protein